MLTRYILAFHSFINALHLKRPQHSVMIALPKSPMALKLQKIYTYIIIIFQLSSLSQHLASLTTLCETCCIHQAPTLCSHPCEIPPSVVLMDISLSSRPVNLDVTPFPSSMFFPSAGLAFFISIQMEI